MNSNFQGEITYKKAITAGAQAIYEINLTKDLLVNAEAYFEGREVNIAKKYGFELPCKYSEYVEFSAQNMPEDKRKQYLSMSSREVLLDAYENNKLNILHEYSMRDIRGNVQYFRKQYVITQSNKNEDIYALIIANDITKQKQNEVIQHDIIEGISTEFTSIYIVDWDTEVIKLFKTANTYPNLIRGIEKAKLCDEAIERYVEMAVHPEDKEYVRQTCNINNLRKVLGKKNVYDISYRRSINGITDHAQMHCVRVDDSIGHVNIVIAIRSIEDIVQKERARERLIQDNIQNLAVVQALCSDYDSVYNINLDGSFKIIRVSNELTNSTSDSLSAVDISYDELFSAYVEERVYEEDKEKLLETANFKSLKEKLNRKRSCSFTFRTVMSGEIHYFVMKCVRIDKNDEFAGIVIGYSNVDEEIEQQKRYERKLEKALKRAKENEKTTMKRSNILYSMMIDNYINAVKVNLDTKSCYKLAIEDNHYVETLYRGGWAFFVKDMLSVVSDADRKRIGSVFERDIYNLQIGETKILLYQTKAESLERDYEWHTATIRILEEDEQRIATIFVRDDTNLYEAINNERRLLRENAVLEQKSRRDGLTGLLNKNTMIEETTAYLENNSAINSALIFFDLDNFKNVNDTLGHSKGDIAIKEAGKRLKDIFDEYELVGRFGGDEFCVFIKNISMEKLKKLLETSVAEMRERHADGETYIDVTTSIGCAYCVAESAQYQPLLDLADEAVYEAKRSGRDRYIIRLYR
ncbi:MAG: GGDEF domain-containing protein [Lachnospiraceae bacterium]|nr:GGDEF domain-containing protein [Lachnospiraceae bacterium]